MSPLVLELRGEAVHDKAPRSAGPRFSCQSGRAFCSASCGKGGRSNRARSLGRVTYSFRRAETFRAKSEEGLACAWWRAKAPAIIFRLSSSLRFWRRSRFSASLICAAICACFFLSASSRLAMSPPGCLLWIRRLGQLDSPVNMARIWAGASLREWRRAHFTKLRLGAILTAPLAGWLRVFLPCAGGQTA